MALSVANGQTGLGTVLQKPAATAALSSTIGGMNPGVAAAATAPPQNYQNTLNAAHAATNAAASGGFGNPTGTGTAAASAHQAAQSGFGRTQTQAPGTVGQGAIGGVLPATGTDPGLLMQAGLNGRYSNDAIDQQKSALNPSLSNQQSDIKQQLDYGLGGPANNAATNAAIAQAQDTGNYYSGTYNNLAGTTGAMAQAAATRGIQGYQGDTSQYQTALNQSAADAGMQQGSYAALNQFANNTPASAATQALGNAGASYGNLNSFAAQPLSYNAQGQLNSVGQSANSLNGIGNSKFTMNAAGQLQAVGQDASNLSSFGNSIGNGPSAAAGNLGVAAQNGQSLSNFGNSNFGASMGQGNLNTAAQAAGNLGQFGTAPIQNAAAQQFAQANQTYGEMQQFQAAPIGPSAAEQQLLQSTDANTQNALAMARSGSGLGSDATAMKQAMLANAGTQQTANSQMAQLRANEYTAYQQQKLAAQTNAGQLAQGMAGQAITQNDTRLGQQEAAMQAQGDISNTAANTQVNYQLQQQAQRQAALNSAAGIADTGGQMQISEENNNQNNRIAALNAAGVLQNTAAATTTSAQMQAEQDRINALSNAGNLQNTAASTMTSAQMADAQNRLAAMTNAGQLANQTAGLQITQQNNNQQNQLAALSAAGQLGTATNAADVARATSGLAGAQYQSGTALQGTQLNDATTQAWSTQQQAAYQQALAAEVGGQTQTLNLNNAALAGRESDWSGINSRYATQQGIASNNAIANAATTEAYFGAGLGAAGTIGAAALSSGGSAALSDEDEKDIVAPLDPTKSISAKVGAGPSLGSPVSAGAVVQPTKISSNASTSNPGTAAQVGTGLATAVAARHAATGAAVGGTAGQIGGTVVGSAIGGPVGGIIGGIVGKIGGGAIGKLIGSDVRNKTDVRPLSPQPGAANATGAKGAFGQLQSLAAQYGAGGVATTAQAAKTYGSQPMTMPALKVTDNQSLRHLTAPGMQGVGPTGNPGDDYLAQSARAAPPSVYTYKNPAAPGAGPGQFTGPMAQDLASHPVTAPAVGKDPSSGKLFVDGGRLALANTAQNHAQQNQLDSLDGKINSLQDYLKSGAPSAYPKPVAPGTFDKSNWGKRYGSGEEKGRGFLGVLGRPDGDESSEISIGVPINGKETEVPSMVPTLSQQEREQLLGLREGQRMPQPIINKATDFAKQRLAAGLSPFASDAESPDNVSLDDAWKRQQMGY